MKIMVVWKTVPGKYKTAIDQFLKAGGPVPAGAKTVGRWHTPGSTLGWHLIEASDLALVAEHVADWADHEVRRHGFRVVRGLSGHGVGRTIHEEPRVPNEYDPWQADVLTEGLVLTIEPMITAGSSQPVEDADGWTIRTRDGSLSAHHEHTIMITRGDAVILTAA
jgi:methionine aminopeptidase